MERIQVQVRRRLLLLRSRSSSSCRSAHSLKIMPGVDGLIHISQIADHRIAKPEDELEVGQVVEAKIIDINDEKKKVSLSIRALLEDEED